MNSTASAAAPVKANATAAPTSDELSKKAADAAKEAAAAKAEAVQAQKAADEAEAKHNRLKEESKNRTEANVKEAAKTNATKEVTTHLKIFNSIMDHHNAVETARKAQAAQQNSTKQELSSKQSNETVATQANKTAVKSVNATLSQVKKEATAAPVKIAANLTANSTIPSTSNQTKEQKMEKEQAKNVWAKNLATQRVEQNLKALVKKNGTLSVEAGKNLTQSAQTNTTILAKTQKPIPKELPVFKKIQKEANATGAAN